MKNITQVKAEKLRGSTEKQPEIPSHRKHLYVIAYLEKSLS